MCLILLMVSSEQSFVFKCVFTSLHVLELSDFKKETTSLNISSKSSLVVAAFLVIDFGLAVLFVVVRLGIWNAPVGPDEFELDFPKPYCFVCVFRVISICELDFPKPWLPGLVTICISTPCPARRRLRLTVPSLLVFVVEEVVVVLLLLLVFVLKFEKIDVKMQKVKFIIIIREKCGKSVKYMYWVKKDLFGCFKKRRT